MSGNVRYRARAPAAEYAYFARFTELEEERAAITAQLAAATAPADAPGDPALPDAIPALAGILSDAPARIHQQLYDAFNLQLLYSKPKNRVHPAPPSPPQPPPPSSATTRNSPQQPHPFPIYRITLHQGGPSCGLLRPPGLPGGSTMPRRPR
jgi:hypothetical protein